MAARSGKSGPPLEAVVHRNINDARIKRDQAKRSEALSFRMAGLTISQIAERLEVSDTAVSELIGRSLDNLNTPEVEELRSLENARLDRAQAAIWSRVLEGDTKAIDSYLRISQRRSRLNGLDAPIKLDLSVSVRQEMEHALTQLEAVVLSSTPLTQLASPYQSPYEQQERADNDDDRD